MDVYNYPNAIKCGRLCVVTQTLADSFNYVFYGLTGKEQAWRTINDYGQTYNIEPTAIRASSRLLKTKMDDALITAYD